jgi:hypothetical protein
MYTNRFIQSNKGLGTDEREKVKGRKFVRINEILGWYEPPPHSTFFTFPKLLV